MDNTIFDNINKKKTKKNCLRCGQEFQSEGIQNRICKRCKREKSMSIEPIYFVDLPGKKSKTPIPISL